MIVLLILAGVTIAALTGSDSAPAKANEAKQRQDIGAAKDEVYLTAQNAQTEAYERIYVNGKQATSDEDVTAGNASTNVGTYVRKKVYEKYKASKEFKTGLASIVATENGEITISTTDFEETGIISSQGGTLDWIKAEPITTVISKENYGEYIDLGTSIFSSGKKIGNLGNENEDVLADWRILYKDTTTGHEGIWVILADYYPMTDEMATATGLTRVSGKTYNVNSDSQDNLIAGLTSSEWSNLTDKGIVQGAVTKDVLMNSYKIVYYIVHKFYCF